MSRKHVYVFVFFEGKIWPTDFTNESSESEECFHIDRLIAANLASSNIAKWEEVLKGRNTEIGLFSRWISEKLYVFWRISEIGILADTKSYHFLWYLTEILKWLEGNRNLNCASSVDYEISPEVHQLQDHKLNISQYCS